MGVGLIERSPEGETAKRVEVSVVAKGILPLMKARREALRRAGRGDRACFHG